MYKKGNKVEATWVAQLVSHLTLDFSSGHDLAFHPETDICFWFHAGCGTCLKFSLSLSLSLFLSTSPLPAACTLSLKKKKKKRGAPGWLSRLSSRLRLGSWSRGPWVRALRCWALCWQPRAWSLFQILCLPLSLLLPCSCSFSVSKINKR